MIWAMVSWAVPVTQFLKRQYWIKWPKMVQLTDFHSNGAVCSPTRAELMTGRYQNRSGIEGVVTAVGHRHTGLDLSEWTMAEALKESGYRTMYSRKSPHQK